jgi:Carboxylesterase family
VGPEGSGVRALALALLKANGIEEKGPIRLSSLEGMPAVKALIDHQLDAIFLTGDSASPRYWTNFARSGDPNGKGLPSWPAFTSTKSRILSFGDPIKVADIANIGSLTVLDAGYASVRGSPVAK